MSFNVLDLAKGYLTDAVVGKLAGSVGEDSSLITKALGAAVPALLGGVLKSGSTSSGLSGIMDVLKNNDHSVLDNLGDVLGNSDKSSGMMSAGSSILSSVLGNSGSGIMNAVSAFTGLGGGSTSSIFSFLAPVVMGIIGKKVQSDGLGMSGLGDLLTSQKDIVSKALPAGLASSLGFGDMMSSAKQTVSNVGNTVEDVADSAGSFNWKPWLIGLLLAAAGWFFFKKCSSEKVADAAESTVAAADTLASATGAAMDSVGSAFGKLGAMIGRKLPDGIELNVPENGIESKLIAFITDGAKAVDKTTWFNFDRINFATGSANLTEESAEQVKNIAAILKAYPKVKLKIGGYTDNTGNAKANIKLSADRAATVMAALGTNGIDKGRLETEGYGDKFPEASNDTEEGRAANRRIAVRVTEK